MEFDELTCVKLEADQESIKWRTESYLRSKGWEHTSSTVGCYWMWFKKIDDRHYGCGTDDAFRIQSHLDRKEYADAHPEQFED